MAESTSARADFIVNYYGLAEQGQAVLFMAGEDKRVLFADVANPAELEVAVAALNGFVDDHDCYYSLSTRRERLPDGRRGGDVDCLHQLAIAVDMDVAGPGHAGTVLFPDVAAALAVLNLFALAPTFIILTGGGVQAGWVFDEAQDANDPFIAGLRRRLIETLRRLAGMFSGAIDSTDDAARVMRLPGSWNLKEGLHRPTELLSADWSVRYGAHDLDDVLDELRPELPRLENLEPKAGSYRSELWPGTDFMTKVPPGDVLTKAGFVFQRADRAGNEYYVRPGKNERDGHSAVVYADDRHTTIYSTAAVAMWPTLEVRRPYDGLGLYAHLFHQGNFTKATEALLGQGFGVPDARKAQLQLIVSEDDDERERLMGEATGRHLHPVDGPRPPPGGDDGDDGDSGPLGELPMIIVNGRDFNEMANESIVALQLHNERSPSLFMRGGVLVALIEDDGSTVAKPVTKDTMPLYVSQSARFRRMLKADEGGRAKTIPAPPPGNLTDALVGLNLPLPRLNGIVNVPIIRPDGSISTVPGYDLDTGLYYSPTSDLEGMTVPEAPSVELAMEALALLDSIIVDFPLEGEVARAHVLALFLTAGLRSMIVAPTPLFAITAPSPGTGKGLTADCAAIIATGHPAPSMGWSGGETEARKRITAVLMAGAPVVSIDNVSKPLGSDGLASALTQGMWSDRLLGRSIELNIPIRCLWMVNGNGLRLTGDLGRRGVIIAMDPQQSQPWRRDGFTHPDLKGWVKANRRDIVRACLILARYWVCQGRPAPEAAPLGSFEVWSHTIGGILGAVGVPGFLGDLGEKHEDYDEEATEWLNFLEALERVYDRPFRSAEAGMLMTHNEMDWVDLIPSELTMDFGRPYFPKRLGEAFSGRRDRRWDDTGLRIERRRRTQSKTATWQIVRDTSPPIEGEETITATVPIVPMSPPTGDQGDLWGPRGDAGATNGPSEEPPVSSHPRTHAPHVPMLSAGDMVREGDPLQSHTQERYRGYSAAETRIGGDAPSGSLPPLGSPCHECGGDHPDSPCPRELW